MNTINEKVKPNANLRIEVDRPGRNTGSNSSPSWLDRLEDWVSFLKDVLKILAE
jgi:hypothetical protein